MSAVIFLAFAQTFYMVYNNTVPGYQNYWTSFMSVLRFTVGDYNYEALSLESPIVTPILFIVLLIIVFFVWVNLVIAIISNIYELERALVDGFSWDDDYEKMTLDSQHPENDVSAMNEHLVTIPGHVQNRFTPRIALVPYGDIRFVRILVSIGCAACVVAVISEEYLAGVSLVHPIFSYVDFINRISQGLKCFKRFCLVLEKKSMADMPVQCI